MKELDNLDLTLIEEMGDLDRSICGTCDEHRFLIQANDVKNFIFSFPINKIKTRKLKS